MNKAGLIILLAAWLLLTGCTSTRYVPGVSVRTEYVSENNAEQLDLIKSLIERLHQKERQVDSLIQSRNERLVLNDKGDTLRHDSETIVYRSSYREKELERIIESKTDSIRILLQKLESAKADSIPVPYPVERKLSKWEQTKIDYGGEAIVALAVVVIAAVVWLIRRLTGWRSRKLIAKQ